MKKLILMISVCFSLAIVSCKETNKEVKTDSDTEMHEEHVADKADIAMNVEYQCPMNCEDGKTYDAAGSCPVCKMDLKKLEKDGEHMHENGESHEDHDSEENHEGDHDKEAEHDSDGDNDEH